MKNLSFLLFALFSFSISQAQIVNIPDAALKNTLLVYEPVIDTNHDGEIQVNEALTVTSLYLNTDGGYIENLTGLEAFTNLTSLGMTYISATGFNPSTLTQLQTLSCIYVDNMTTLDLSGMTSLRNINTSETHLTSLNISGLINLRNLKCYGNPISSLNLTGLINLETLDCNSTGLTSLNLSGLSSLLTIDCSSNTQLSSLITTGANNITSLNCSNCNLTSLAITNLTQLNNLNCGYQKSGGGIGISNLDLTGLNSLTFLNCSGNNLSSLDVAPLTNLNQLSCSDNHLTSLNVAPLVNLESLGCGGNQLTTLNVTPLTNLLGLGCGGNSLSNIDISTLTNLDYLDVDNNNINALDLSNNSSLTEIYGYQNSLTTLSISNLVNLRHLNFSDNQLTTIDVTNLHALQEIRLNGNLFTAIDFSQNPAISAQGAFVSDCPNLTYINAKNGASGQNTLYGLVFNNCPNLQNICTNEDDIATLVQEITAGILGSTPTTVQVNSYCSFVPGGINNIITGTVTLDTNHNGCDTNDIHPKDFKININDSSTSGATFTSANGSYQFYTQVGNIVLTPQFSNPYFTITPSTSTITFATLDGSTQTQNYCAIANGIHHDLEITLYQIANARPGFDAKYAMTYKNNGTEIESGNINLSFDDAVLDFVSATPPIVSQSTNSLGWNYSNLLQFESRTIFFTLNVNGPTETPAVNIDDILNYTATINSIGQEETPVDNTFNLSQTVRGSYDPNDKICLEGNFMTPQMVGGYLHYLINFQNSGTAPAENIVVKDILDSTKFDVSSLQLVSSSDPMETRLTGNKVEFIFENINLPTEIDNEPASHGFVAFKIKTKSNLVLGNTVSNTANIYFDYNFPIITNTTSTTVSTLSNHDFENTSVSISPNPVKNTLLILADDVITSIQLFDVQGRLITTKLNSSLQTTLDLSQQQTGVYFVKVYTDNGMKVQKVIKQ